MDINQDKYLRNLKEKSPIKWKVLGFTKLPSRLIFENKVSCYALLVFWCIQLHSFGKKNGGFPSIPLMGKEMKIGRNTTIRALKELQSAKYIKRTKDKGRRNIYEILI